MNNKQKIVAVILESGMISGNNIIRKLPFEPTLETMQSLLKEKVICSSPMFLVNDKDVKRALYAPLSRATKYVI